MFQSDEPGYYENGFFGIRLETDIEVVEAKTTVFILLISFFLILSNIVMFQLYSSKQGNS